MKRLELVQLAIVPLLFIGAVLLFTPLRVSFRWDETVYASQISLHTPMQWGPERARGLPLLAAPLTMLSTSITLLRAYLAVMAGIGMYLASLAWRGMRATWVIVLATAIFAGLAVTQSYASLLYPNYWAAIGALATLGLTVRVTKARSPRDLLLLAVAVALTGLIRPADAIALCLPITVVVTVVSRKESWRALAAIAGGLAIALGEWLAESLMYFGGVSSRLHLATLASGGSRFDPLNNLRVLGGGGTAPPSGYAGPLPWTQPYLLIWWGAFFFLAILGVWVARRQDGWLLAALPLICAASIYVLYSFPVLDSARYLLPAWALLSIPVADGAVWLLKQGGMVRAAALATVTTFVVAELISQHTLVVTHSAELVADAHRSDRVVSALRRIDIDPPCVVTTVPLKRGYTGVSETAAYFLGCSFYKNINNVGLAPRDRIIVLVHGKQKPWAYAVNWRKRRAGSIVAYIQPWHKDGQVSGGPNG